MESRFLQVPPGLDGTRADAGLAKLLGLSRTAVVTMLDDCLLYTSPSPRD